MRLRPPVADDAPAVLAVLLARDEIDLGRPDYTLDDLRDEWRLGEFDLATDAVVVEADRGLIVGYAVVRSPGALAVVAPGHEGRGVGTLLLRWTERRQREQGRDRYRQWVAATNEGAARLLRAAGYAPERVYTRMVRPLDEVTGAGGVPAGFSLRPVDPARDAPDLHAVDAASFAALPDYQPESLNAFREEHLGAHDFDSAMSRVAERDGRVVGFLLARHWRDDAAGFVDLLAVHPDFQGRGVGTALLESAFARFAASGLREAQLGVASDNPRALRLYERAGMRPAFQSYIYARAVPARVDSTREPEG